VIIKTASLPKDINESKYRTFTCYYSQYNEHGDWTISQCFNGDNELDMSITRKLSTCYYSQYNEHGDWTFSQCFNGDSELDMSITRKLEY